MKKTKNTINSWLKNGGHVAWEELEEIFIWDGDRIFEDGDFYKDPELVFKFKTSSGSKLAFVGNPDGTSPDELCCKDGKVLENFYMDIIHEVEGL